MGGNAIQNARRISKQEFLEICHELQGLFPELKMKVVKAYRQKNDFGDIDIVVETQPTMDINALVKDRLSPSDEYNNGPFYSFEFKGVQVDFIKMSPDNFLSALGYFHWNDLGNFIGRVSRSLNFKFGHDGLVYEKHLDDHYKISVTVTKDIEKALEFLGYNVSKWLQGFDTMEDIFHYATTSPYFNSLYFDLEEQNHNDRVRNRKRKMYQNMLAYIKEKGIEPREKLTEDERMVHYDRARVMFGNDFHNEVVKAEKEYARKLEFKKYFNGEVISKLTGLTGKDLGKFMQEMKTKWDFMIILSPNADRKWNEFVEEVLEYKEDAVRRAVASTVNLTYRPEPLTDLSIVDSFTEETLVYGSEPSMSSGVSSEIHVIDDIFYEYIFDIYNKKEIVVKRTKPA